MLVYHHSDYDSGNVSMLEHYDGHYDNAEWKVQEMMVHTMIHESLEHI